MGGRDCKLRIDHCKLQIVEGLGVSRLNLQFEIRNLQFSLHLASSTPEEPPPLKAGAPLGQAAVAEKIGRRGKDGTVLPDQQRFIRERPFDRIRSIAACCRRAFASERRERVPPRTPIAAGP